jgi:aspartate racemase
VRPESRAAYQGVIGQLAEAGAEGIILGCTEFELLIDPSDRPLPNFPTTRLHVEAAVELALGQARVGREMHEPGR